MTVEETRAQLGLAKHALEEAMQELVQAGECYAEASVAIVACGAGSAHSEPETAGAELKQAEDGAGAAVTYAQATNANIDQYSDSI